MFAVSVLDPGVALDLGHLVLADVNGTNLLRNADFSDGMAHVKAKLELGLHDHTLKLVLPAMDVIPDSYQGQRLVQVNVPLLERHF